MRFLIIILCCFVLTGCVSGFKATRSDFSTASLLVMPFKTDAPDQCWLGDIIEKYAKWEDCKGDAMKELAKVKMKHWLLYSGMIREGLGARMEFLPAEVVKAMDRMDEHATKYKTDPNSITDKELGGVIGLEFLMLNEIVVEALKRYAPNILRYIPVLFGGEL